MRRNTPRPGEPGGWIPWNRPACSHQRWLNSPTGRSSSYRSCSKNDIVPAAKGMNTTAWSKASSSSQAISSISRILLKQSDLLQVRRLASGDPDQVADRFVKGPVGTFPAASTARRRCYTPCSNRRAPTRGARSRTSASYSRRSSASARRSLGPCAKPMRGCSSCARRRAARGRGLTVRRTTAAARAFPATYRTSRTGGQSTPGPAP